MTGLFGLKEPKHHIQSYDDSMWDAYGYNPFGGLFGLRAS